MDYLQEKPAREDDSLGDLFSDTNQPPAGGRDMGKKVVDAKADAKGNITAVKLSGNSGFTPLETAMRMADKGQIENAHTVNREGAKPHLRTNPNSQIGDNLDDMAGDS